jgi:hypothetical protein
MTRDNARRLAGAGLILGAIGIVFQIAGGADYPAVPPGLIILLVAAGLVLFAPWGWAVVLAGVATLFLSVGGVVAPGLRDQLSNPGAAASFFGSLIQTVGLIAALAGFVLIAARRRSVASVR